MVLMEIRHQIIVPFGFLVVTNLSNNFKIQYGYKAWGSPNACTINFPITYTTKVSVSSSMLTTVQDVKWFGYTNINSISKSGFVFKNEAGIGCSWVSCGY